MTNKFIEWKDYFSVGIDLLDDQHKRMIELINHLFTAKNSEKHLFIEEFVKYAYEHFAVEEKILEKIKYPDKHKHIESHKFFDDTIKTLREKIENYTIDDLFNFAVDWLAEHILSEDQQYANFIQKNNIKIKAEDIL